MYLSKDHGRDFLGREGLLLAQVLNLDHGVATLVDDLEGPRLNVLGDGLILEATADQSPSFVSSTIKFTGSSKNSYLTSKTVLAGFIAAWFFAASPIKRSSLVKETKDGVVKLPCSLATIQRG